MDQFALLEPIPAAEYYLEMKENSAPIDCSSMNNENSNDQSLTMSSKGENFNMIGKCHQDELPSSSRSNSLSLDEYPSTSCSSYDQHSSSSENATIIQPDESLESTDYIVVQVNGARIYGPPKNWTGQPPSNNCELYVKGIPKDFSEDQLIHHFSRFGKIYTFRLMMNYNNRNRGYAFVKYANEVDCLRANEVLQYFYIQTHRLLQIERSFDKCRLYFGNIPKHLAPDDVERELRRLFPKLTDIHFCSRTGQPEYPHRGFVFVDFPDHATALKAKQKCVPTLVLWSTDLRVMWADPDVSTPDSGEDREGSQVCTKSHYLLNWF